MENEKTKQFLMRYEKLRGKVESTWAFYLDENNDIAAFPKSEKLDHYKKFKPLFELTALDINKGLESEKWDMVLKVLNDE